MKLWKRVLLVVAAAVLVFSMAFSAALYDQADRAARREQIQQTDRRFCELAQGLWQGAIDYTQFLGDEFVRAGASTPQRTAESIARLKERIGQTPPTCPVSSG